MRFKGILCLTKVSKNQTQTERNENTILFNTSNLELVNDTLNMKINDREVLYVASSQSEKERENGLSHYKVDINWVECFKSGEHSFELPCNVTDILIITKEIYANMRLNGLKDNEIYCEFKEKGLGKISAELNNVEDFSALVAQIVE